jgi:CubicO group peptidase (beta-lactamase class C family)
LPPRGTHQPGTHFLYNNWDFNALGTILERHTSKSMFNDFADTIATPSGMQDFDRSQQHYDIEPWSEHRTYAFHFSTRDLARFGQLYLRGGQHGGSTIIPPEWVIASTRAHTKTDNGPSYGYLWWVAHNGQPFAGTAVPDGSFAPTAQGANSCWSYQRSTASSRYSPTRGALAVLTGPPTGPSSPNSCTTPPRAQ